MSQNLRIHHLLSQGRQLCGVPKNPINILAIHRRSKRSRKPTKKKQSADEDLQAKGKGKATNTRQVKRGRK
jgi:hypothetical protein